MKFSTTSNSSAFKKDIEDVIVKIKNGVNVTDLLTSKFFKPEMRPALEIVNRWTFNHAYVDERAIPELQALI